MRTSHARSMEPRFERSRCSASSSRNAPETSESAFFATRRAPAHVTRARSTASTSWLICVAASMNCALREDKTFVKRVSTTSRCFPRVSCRRAVASFFSFFVFSDGTRRTDASRSEPFRVSMTLRAAMLTCVASGAYASPHTPANTAGSESSNASSKNAGGTSRSGSSAAAAAAAADPEPASLSAVRPRGAGSGSEENAGRREDEASGWTDSSSDSTFARSPPAPAPTPRIPRRYGSKSARSTSGSTPG